MLSGFPRSVAGFNAYHLIEADNGIIDFDRSLRDFDPGVRFDSLRGRVDSGREVGKRASESAEGDTDVVAHKPNGISVA